MTSNEKKDKMLDAASLCIERFGYEKTTLDDIGNIILTVCDFDTVKFFNILKKEDKNEHS